jgi:mannosyltransferase OCH1-like enzyme
MIIIITIIIILYLLYLYREDAEYFDIVTSNKNTKKNIIQTWKNNKIPYKYHSGIKSLKNYNNDYNFIFFTDTDIEVFLKNNYPEYYKTYLLLPYKIQKIDFFRYIAVYHFGGYYFDLDISADDKLDKLNTKNNVAYFPIDMHIDEKNIDQPRFKKYADLGFLVGQYAFYAPKYHPFIKSLIDGIYNNIQMYISEKKNTEQYIYDTTGPDYVTQKFIKYMGTIDYRNYPVHILQHPSNQKFGRYASHNYFGTWKA